MTTPIYARKAPDNTVHVLDGVFVDDGKFALLVEDQAALNLLTAIANNTTITSKNYSFTLAWADGNLSTVTRTADGISEQAQFTYDGNDNLTGVSAWATVGGA